MAYVTGTANTLAALLTAVQNACTANGWVLGGNVLSKGTCYVSLDIAGSTLRLIGGTGKDGGGNLTGASDRGYAYMGQSIALYRATAVPFGWPITYYIHIGTAPDEVYVVCNYGAVVYQSLAWGQSSIAGLAGTGNWYVGSNGGTSYGGVAGSGQAEYSYDGYASTGINFSRVSATTSIGVDHRLDSATWALEGASSSSFGDTDAASVMRRQPNQWNGESILFPVRAYAARPNGYFSLVLDCAHARLVNLQGLADQQIITLGSDRWRVYPWYTRSTSVGQNGQLANKGSGFCGTALRYDGP